MTLEIFTLGYTGYSWRELSLLLRRYPIETVVDVRRLPTSRTAPYTHIHKLPSLLGRRGLRYTFMGDELGDRAKHPQPYGIVGRPNYAEIARNQLFIGKIDELCRLATQTAVVLLSEEENPHTCHRERLIAPALRERGLHVRHIRGSGLEEEATEQTSKPGYQLTLV